MDPKKPEKPSNGHKHTPDEFVDIVYDDGPGDTTVRPAGPDGKHRLLAPDYSVSTATGGLLSS